MIYQNCISCVMIIVLVLSMSVVDCGFEPRSGQLKTVKLIFVASPLSMQCSGERAKTGCLGIRIMCLSGVTCLPAYCCFSEVVHVLLTSNYVCWSSTKQTSLSYHVTCSRSGIDIAEKLLIWRYTTITHSYL